MHGGLLRRHAHLNRREQSPRRRGERRWATRAVRLLVRVAAGAESASSALQREGTDPTNSAQVAYCTGHVNTQCVSDGVEALRIMQVDHRHTSLCVDAQKNECALTCVSRPARTVNQRLHLYRRCSPLFRH